jgi:predicted DsbA family dithiol-disulfide isomerase
VSARFVVFGDFVCPWSYVALDSVQRLSAEFALTPHWLPYWLHPEVPPEGTPRPADDESRQATRAWFAETVPETAARMHFPDRLHSSFLAFEAREFASEHNRALPFTEAVFDALWVKERDISQIPVLERAAADVGLDAAALGRALATHAYAPRALRTVATASRLGVTATPTFFVGRTRIDGWHYEEVLRTVMEREGMAPTGPDPA